MRNSFFSFFNQKISNFSVSFLIAASMALLAGCGSGVPPGTATTGGTVAAPTLVLQLYDAAGAVSTLVSPSAPGTVRATLQDATGVAVANTVVTFTITDTTLATVGQATALTNSSGIATVTVSATGAAGATSITASATVTDTTAGALTVTGSTSFAVVASGGTSATPTLTMLLTNSSGIAITTITPSVQGTVKATVRDTAGVVVPGSIVTFSITNTALASVSQATALTDSFGVATVKVTAEGTGATSITASSVVGGLTASSSLNFSVATNTPSLSLELTSTAISTGFPSIVTATLRDGTGTVMSGVSVTFTVDNPTLASVSPVSATTNAFGVATATLTAGTGAGSTWVQATAPVNDPLNNNLVTSSQRTFSVGTTIASLSLSASPTTVKSDNSNSSTITVTALSAANAATPGVVVSLDASTGIISTNSVTTDATGKATFTFTSGTASKSNRTATITADAGVSKTLPVEIVGSTLTVNATGTTIPADSTTSVTMTFTAKDAGGNPVSGTAVTLTKPTGVALSPSSGSTDANGQLVVTVTGSAVTSGDVTATAVGTTASAPINVTSISATFGISKSQLNGDAFIANPTAVTMPLKVIANNASIAADAVTVTVGSTTGLTAGDTVSGGGFPSGTTVSSVTNLTTFVADTSSTLVTGLAVNGQTLRFGVDSRLVVLVKAPLPTNTVIFATTMGSWIGSGSSVSVPVGGPSCGFAGYTITPAADEACATLTTSAAGLADIQVYDAAAPNTTDTLSVSMTAIMPYKITVQASPSLVSKSVGSTTGVSTLIATVKDSSDQLVGGVPVQFTILNATGGSERVSPVVVYTAATATPSLALGQALTTFTSGSQSSGAGGVQVRATVLGAGGSCPGATCVATEANVPIVLNVSPSGNDAAIVIGGTAGSIAFGQATVLGETANGTSYTSAMSVLVTDSNGNPVPGTVVNLSAWPIAWSTGYSCSLELAAGADSGTGEVILGNSLVTSLDFDPTGLEGQFVLSDSFPNGTTVISVISPTSFRASSPSTKDGTVSIAIGQLATYYNEDINENLFLDSGEDGSRDYYYGGGSPGVGTLDGLITPVNSAAGSVPGTVTTDDTGLATFTLTYPKTSAIWTVDRIRAKTVVQGTEMKSEIQFPLAATVPDVTPCYLGNSPYNF